MSPMPKASKKMQARIKLKRGFKDIVRFVMRSNSKEQSYSSLVVDNDLFQSTMPILDDIA